MARELNPANAGADMERTRVPMSTPKLQLEVDPIAGYKLYWFADRPGRIARAQAAGYEFVGVDEVSVHNGGFANDLLESGSTDLGSKVSLVGGRGENGGAERLYLMKIKQEWWDKDQEAIQARNEAVAAAIRGGVISGGTVEQGVDKEQRYGGQIQPTRKGGPNLFTPKRR